MRRRAPPKPRFESELRAPVRAFLEADGYRVWTSPDGADFLDVVAVRGETVGLVELKLADWRKVRAQGIVRRALADWVAVAVPTERLAERIARSGSGPVAPRLGIWIVDDAVRVLREAQPLEPPPQGTPAAEARQRFRSLLSSAADLPEAIAWGATARRTGGGKGYRLDEFDGEAPG